MGFLAFLMLMLCLAVADAQEVYRWVAPDGSVHYSDRPYPGADRIALPKLPPAQPRRYVPGPTPKATGKPVFYVYNRLTIVKPEPGGTVHDNQGNIAIGLTIEPKLNTTNGHKIQILLDGRGRGAPLPSLEQSLTGIERGRHTIAAQVIDERGRVLIRSRPVSFYIKRESPLFHSPRPDTPHTGVQQAPRAPMAPRAPRAPHAPFIPAPPRPTPLPGSRSGAG